MHLLHCEPLVQGIICITATFLGVVPLLGWSLGENECISAATNPSPPPFIESLEFHVASHVCALMWLSTGKA